MLRIGSIKLVVFVLVTISGANLAGCRQPGEAAILSTKHGGDPAPVERLLIHTRLGFRPGESAAFQAGLTTRLAACRVIARFLDYDPMALDAIGDLRKAMEEFRPTTMLMISKAAGTHFVENGAKWTVKLEVLDVASRITSWSAQSTFLVTRGTPWASFATRAVTQLRDDSVLTSCPRNERYPGCYEERRQSLAEANQIGDKFGRITAVEAAPRCDVPAPPSPGRLP
jgi:hypothetical protein